MRRFATLPALLRARFFQVNRCMQHFPHCQLQVATMSRAETTPPQQAGAPVRASRQGVGRFGRQLLAPRSGLYQLLHLRQSWNCVSVPLL